MGERCGGAGVLSSARLAWRLSIAVVNRVSRAAPSFPLQHCPLESCAGVCVPAVAHGDALLSFSQGSKRLGAMLSQA